MSSQPAIAPAVTLSTLNTFKQKGEKFTCLTAYDSSFTRQACLAGVETLLIGDSLGMVLQGHESTLPVTLEQMAYHTACVHRANQGALLITDMPFMSYASENEALGNAATLMRAGAHVVKIEGGAWLADTTRLLAERGIPVCVHMGLTPQSINRLGGYRVQGRDPQQAETMLAEAKLLEAAGASLLLLECVPRGLAKSITEALSIPVIGIGAGPDTDAQVLVLHDVIGVSPIKPKFVKNFLAESTEGVQGAFRIYVREVKNGSFPAPEHCFD